MFEKRNAVLLSASVVAATLSSAAFAAQRVHFDQNFMDGSLADEVGSVTNIGGTMAIRTQQAWRNPGQSYFGVDPATAFDPTPGFGPNQFRTTAVNNATLDAGNVWVVDMSMISDVATTHVNTGALQNAPGVAVEWDWVTPLDFTFSKSSVSMLRTSVERSVFAVAYPNGADSAARPNAIPNTLTDPNLPTALNGTLRTKFAYHEVGSGLTRVSTQALTGNTPIGSTGNTDGTTGSFRSDYTGGLFAQVLDHHGDGNVTYASGHGGGQNVAYNAADTNLQLGLTHLTFKQVSAADNTTDGNVDLNDGGNLVANWNPGGSGRDFFQGDTNGDGQVNLDDGGALVSAWTAAPDNIGAGTGRAVYNPADGHVQLEVNGVALWRIDSPVTNFTGAPTDLDPSAGVRWTIPGTTKQADAQTIGELALSNSINFNNIFNMGTFTFDYNGLPGDLGAILPAGLTEAQVVNVIMLSYNTLGGQQQTISLEYIPEPGTFGVLALGAGFAALRRRRKAC